MNHGESLSCAVASKAVRTTAFTNLAIAGNALDQTGHMHKRLSAWDALIPGTFSIPLIGNLCLRISPAGIDKQRLWGSRALASLLLVRSTSSNCNLASDTRFTNQYRWRSLRT